MTKIVKINIFSWLSRSSYSYWGVSIKTAITNHPWLRKFLDNVGRKEVTLFGVGMAIRGRAIITNFPDNTHRRHTSGPRCVGPGSGPPVGRRCVLSGMHMMTSSNGNIFRVTGPLCGEFTGHRCNPRTKASDAELWCFLWFVPEQMIQ